MHSTLRLLDHCFSGNVPDQAVFLNGFNDCYYSAGGADGIVPFFDEILERSQDSEFRNTLISEIVELIPNIFKESLTFDSPFLLSESIKTCLANIKLRYTSALAIQHFIESSFGVRIRRFIEPNQSLNCRTDQRLLPRVSESNPRRLLVESLYKEIDGIGLKKVFGARVVSLLDIGQEKEPFPLYLDHVHFTPAMNKLLASNIGGFIKIGQISPSGKKLEPKTPVAKSDELLKLDNYPLF